MLPNRIAAIIADPSGAPVPDNPLEVYDVWRQLLPHVKDAEPATLEAIATYVVRLPNEFATVFFLDALKANKGIQRSKALQHWCKSNCALFTSQPPKRLYRLDLAIELAAPIYLVAHSMANALEQARRDGYAEPLACSLVPRPPSDAPDPEYRDIRRYGQEAAQRYFDARDLAYGQDK